jgi:hypothetical protein
MFFSSSLILTPNTRKSNSKPLMWSKTNPRLASNGVSLGTVPRLRKNHSGLKPAFRIANVASGFFMKVSHTNPVR